MSKSHDPIPPFDLPSEIKSKLTPRQAALLRFYYDPTSPAFGNATEAAARAGYQGSERVWRYKATGYCLAPPRRRRWRRPWSARGLISALANADMEGVCCISAMRRGIGERIDDLHLLDDGAGPAVCND